MASNAGALALFTQPFHKVSFQASTLSNPPQQRASEKKRIFMVHMVSEDSLEKKVSQESQ
jgi:hypothetical protein